MSPEDKDGTPNVHFLEDLIAVAPEDAARAAQISGGSVAGPEQVARILQASPEAGARLEGLVGLVAVDDPVRRSEQLASESKPILASPIHGLGFHWHIAYAPLPPSKTAGAVFPKVAPGHRDRVIAVVDTGVVADEDLPGWIRGGLIADAEDVETPDKGEASHGTFITGLIRQIAPAHTVSVARAGVSTSTVPRPKVGRHRSTPYPTTELHVADAILRLIERHRHDDGVVALSMSVGGPSWAPRTQRSMIALSRALDRWHAVFPKCEIFAAAGNTDDPQPVYPAAFREVRGVAAAANLGAAIVWDGSTEIPAPFRRWVSDVAPGSGLLGISGTGAPSDVVAWSGSSFATAAAAASYANGGPVETRRGISWWPGLSMDYTRLAGLRFVP